MRGPQEPPLKPFRVKDERINELKGEKVDILIYLSLASNYYVLDILAGLSRALKRLTDDNGYIKGTVEIKFLIMSEISRKVDLIKNPLIEHNEYLVEGLRKEKGEVDEKKFFSLIQFRYKEFQSLINRILMGLTHIKNVKDIVLKNTEYEDIEKYVEKNNITVIDDEHDRIRNFRESIEEVPYFDENGNPQMHPLTKPTKETTLDKEHPVFDELLKIITHRSRNREKEKKLILVVSDVMEAMINEYYEKIGSENIFDSDKIYFCVYPTLLLGPFELFTRPYYPGYYTILSRFYNEKSEEYKEFKKKIDELWFSEMLTESDSEKLENLNSRVFKDKIEEIANDSREYNEIDRSQGLSHRDSMYIDMYEGEFIHPRYQNALHETINGGFLTIQEDLISQLKLIL